MSEITREEFDNLDKIVGQLFAALVQVKAQVAALGEILIINDVTDAGQIAQMEQANLEFLQAEMQSQLDEPE